MLVRLLLLVIVVVVGERGELAKKKPTIPAKIIGPLTCKQARKQPPHPPSMLVAQIIAHTVQ